MKRPAEDAGKMALTDALTKGLSHLGCDADVFLGKHDNKQRLMMVRQNTIHSNGGNMEYDNTNTGAIFNSNSDQLILVGTGSLRRG
ncbi:MAG: hypothetical protein CM15mV81_400 [uncultured marine virus]|nr:MAG: hypothetical protein CM15mV81_400 [uncultured marine virus]